MRQLLIALLVVALLVQGCGRVGLQESTSTPTRGRPAATGPKRAERPVSAKMRYKLRDGARFVYDTNSTATLSFSGITRLKTTLDLGVRNTQTVTAVKGTVADAQMTFDDIRASLNGKSLPESITNKAHGPLKRLVFNFKLDTTGKVTKLDIPQSGGSTTPIPGISGPFGPMLPSREVIPGDSWTTTESPGLGGGLMNGVRITTKYTFDKWVEQDGMKLARNKASASAPDLYTTTLHLKDARLQFSYLFDQASGRMVSGKGTVTGGFEPLIDILRSAGSGTVRYDIDIKVTPAR